MDVFGVPVVEVDEGGRPRLRGKDDGDGDDNWRERERMGEGENYTNG